MFMVTFDYSDSDSDRERAFNRVEAEHGPGTWRRGEGSCPARAVFEFVPAREAKLLEIRIASLRQSALTPSHEGDWDGIQSARALTRGLDEARASGDAARIRMAEQAILNH